MPIVMYKKVGETPLECLNRLRVERPQYAIKPGLPVIPLTYVGRLDPMAEGLLLVLAGEECKEREKYLDLEKEYVCEILWLYSTDTYDVLGKVKRSHTRNVNIYDVNDRLSAISEKLVGKMIQKFPPYSSKPVKGKPLVFWAREGRLDEIEIPSKEIEIKELEVLGTRFTEDWHEVEKKILGGIGQVKGDFRQDEIIKLWQGMFSDVGVSGFLVSKIRIVCSSGTYVRGLVDDMGKALGIGATVLSLVRTRIGDYKE